MKYVCPDCIGFGVAAGIKCRRCGGSGDWVPVITNYDWREARRDYTWIYPYRGTTSEPNDRAKEH